MSLVLVASPRDRVCATDLVEQVFRHPPYLRSTHRFIAKTTGNIAHWWTVSQSLAPSTNTLVLKVATLLVHIAPVFSKTGSHDGRSMTSYGALLPIRPDRRNRTSGRLTGKTTKTYNTRDSLVVTHPTTGLAVTGLSMGERTGSRVLQHLWSYVLRSGPTEVHIELEWPAST
jgi:hypothetical protein